MIKGIISFLFGINLINNHDFVLMCRDMHDLMLRNRGFYGSKYLGRKKRQEQIDYIERNTKFTSLSPESKKNAKLEGFQKIESYSSFDELFRQYAQNYSNIDANYIKDKNIEKFSLSLLVWSYSCFYFIKEDHNEIVYQEELIVENIKCIENSQSRIQKNDNGFSKNILLTDSDIDKNRKSIREKTLERDSYICTKCSETDNLDVHHILPKSMGGKDTLDNLTVLCRSCHNEEHNFNIDERERTGKRKEMSWKLKLIHQALNEGNTLKIKHVKNEDVKNKVTIRDVKPLRIYFENGRQYLEAYCYLRNKNRSFRVARIEKMSLSSNH